MYVTGVGTVDTITPAKPVTGLNSTEIILGGGTIAALLLLPGWWKLAGLGIIPAAYIAAGRDW